MVSKKNTQICNTLHYRIYNHISKTKNSITNYKDRWGGTVILWGYWLLLGAFSTLVLPSPQWCWEHHGLPSCSYSGIILNAYLRLLTYPCSSLTPQHYFLDHSVRNLETSGSFHCFFDKADPWNVFGTGVGAGCEIYPLSISTLHLGTISYLCA